MFHGLWLGFCIVISSAFAQGRSGFAFGERAELRFLSPKSVCRPSTCPEAESPKADAARIFMTGLNESFYRSSQVHIPGRDRAPDA